MKLFGPPFFRNVLRPTLSLLFATPALLVAVPIANPDGYEVNEDTTLLIDAASGVLLNDSAGVNAALETDVTNGSLDLNADGSFSYTPTENFNGTDSFSYRAEELPDVLRFTINRSSSTVNVSAAITASGITQTRSDNSSVTGTLDIRLAPPSAPFDEVHIQAADLVVADAVELNYGVIFLFSVDVSADAGALTVNLETPGPPTTADGAGMFTQVMNTLALAGTLDVSTSGIDLGVPDGEQSIDTTISDVEFGGTLTESGGVITLNLPVNFSGVFPIGGNNVDLVISGTLVATAPVPAVDRSAPATVTIDVDPVNDAPLAFSESYYVFDGETLVVPAAAPGGDQVLIPAGAEWRYLDDGSDAGTAWREPSFDDSSWASGAAELGYGDDDEVTAVSFGGDMDNKFVTTYFRRSFDLAGRDQTGDLVLRLKRDDGAAVYLNGVEVLRDGLPVDAAFDTLALVSIGGDDESTFFEYSISPAALVEGSNVLAVEVHQINVTSSDISFDLDLTRVPAAGLLANDSDIDEDTLSATVVFPPANGSVTANPDGSFEYTPDPGFVGVDPFVYEVSDSGTSVQVQLVPDDASWRFLDDGSDQGVAWRATGFDDSAWGKGEAQLGYGEDDETTIVGFGGDEANKFVTTYFRHAFYVGDPSAVSSMALTLLRDDAAAVFVNGTEVFRDSTLTATAPYDELASAAIDEAQSEIVIAVPTATLLTGSNVIAVEVHQNSAGSSDLSFALSVAANAPALAVVMDRGGDWRYLDDGSDQGTAWNGSGFDDSAWGIGAAPLGYGADEVTSVSFGGDGDNKFATTYFRREFEVVNGSEAIAARLRVRRDDGVAVYLNGVEIARSNLDPGAGATDLAANTTGSRDVFLEFPFDASLLNSGTNVLAAEVHQASATSSDIIFDAEVAISVAQNLRVARVNVVSAGANPDSDNDGMLDSYEIANGLTVGIDDSMGDLDGDGQRNLSESIAGTRANDSNSLLRITAVVDMEAAVQIAVSTVAGKTYQLELSDTGEVWSDVPGGTWVATGDSSLVETSRPAGGLAFWKVRVLVLP